MHLEEDRRPWQTRLSVDLFRSLLLSQSDGGFDLVAEFQSTTDEMHKTAIGNLVRR